jgi:hypothetical protein
MHDGNVYFLLFVFIATSFHGLTYFLTGRAALAIAQHAAWDFTLIVIFGFGVTIDSGSPMIFHASLPSLVSATSFTWVIFMGILVMEIIGLGLIISWVRWRYGKIRLKKKLEQPFWQYLPRKS